MGRRKKKTEKRLNTHFMPYPHETKHKVNIGEDDGEPIVFKWNFPRGTLEERMSAYELALFILPHMPHIAPLLSHHQRVYEEWCAMMVMLISSPKEVIDRIVPWIRPVVKQGDFDTIELCINATAPQKSGPKYFT